MNVRRLLPVVVVLAASSLHAADPHFETFTPESLRDAIRVGPRRNYAVFGFNDPAVTVRLPMVTNSIYAVVTFEPPKLTDAHGRDVPYELEQGIFDFDRSTTEVRMTKAKDFAHAIGRLSITYPIVVATRTFKKSGKEVTIDGSKVTLHNVELPEAATFSKIEPVRAYDASGNALAHVESTKSPYEFRGRVASVKIDRVENWTEVEVEYDLPPAPKLKASEQGLTPPLEEQFKRMETPGGKVTKALVSRERGGPLGLRPTAVDEKRGFATGRLRAGRHRGPISLWRRALSPPKAAAEPPLFRQHLQSRGWPKGRVTGRLAIPGR